MTYYGSSNLSSDKKLKNYVNTISNISRIGNNLYKSEIKTSWNRSASMINNIDMNISCFFLVTSFWATRTIWNSLIPLYTDYLTISTCDGVIENRSPRPIIDGDKFLVMIHEQHKKLFCMEQMSPMLLLWNRKWCHRWYGELAQHGRLWFDVARFHEGKKLVRYLLQYLLSQSGLQSRGIIPRTSHKVTQGHKLKS